MKKSEIGVLIRRGHSISEIQNIIKEFPDKPDIKYMEGQGYSPNTAKEYLRKLEKNSKLKESEINTEKECYDKTLLIFSDKADTQNIILDTSSLGRKSCRDIIDKSRNVTVLYCILREFDKILKNDEKSDKIKNPVKKYVDEMLYNNGNKYKLVPYRYNDIREADDIIIDYVLEQSLIERPTILTADKRLALKAKSFGFEYILYWRREGSKEDTYREKTIDVCGDRPNVESGNSFDAIENKPDQKKQINKTTDLAYKVDFSENNENIIVKMGAKVTIHNDTIEVKKYNFGARIFIVRDNAVEEIFDCEIARNFDYLVVMCKVKKYGLVKISKILMEDDDVKVADYECSCINEIYALEKNIEDEILNELREMLLS